MQTIDGRREDAIHLSWSPRHPAIAEVAPGESFEVIVPDSSTGQLDRNSDSSDLARVDLARVDAAVGPIRVRGALPGDRLEVALEAIRPAEWGWSAIFRHFGFLQDRFDDELVVWELGKGGARPVRGFLRRIRLPLAPMLGVVGVAPRRGALPMIPPGPFGGNMDSRLNRAGTRVILPVFHAGALLSFGDPHALQGDGEVCGTGIETPARVRARVRLLRGRAASFPQMRVAAESRPTPSVYVTTGVGRSLERIARSAVESMIIELSARGWEPREAYLLASLLGNLRISEVVDDPHRVVSFTFPERFLVPPSA